MGKKKKITKKRERERDEIQLGSDGLNQSWYGIKGQMDFVSHWDQL